MIGGNKLIKLSMEGRFKYLTYRFTIHGILRCV